ncbi:hypothetical protein BZG36_04112 [Bifiguratus adelaidae]|uniref:AB hydrolase-1 domain-containing protein n=1 Tax=Bifiguratus adelaidae TaxID=1938954 RepID=A0A261XX41_9FUNG|nr:hypothetical protein BZG36_04112 [Bifiguratus adelaidae]
MPFKAFTSQLIEVESAALSQSLAIHALVGGQGPPLLLLHGYPQNYFIWHLIADDLATRFTVVAADLRGYGRSSKPQGSPSHIEYSKREMAADQVAIMKKLGFSSFYIVAHDRGARVAHRLALDYPHVVRKMILLDICPTLAMYESTDMKFAAGYWHWFFNIIPTPHAENIISADPLAFWNALARRETHKDVIHTTEALEEYQSAFFKPDTIHATCEDYRAAATIDLEHDRADLANNHKLSVPALRILWGKKGIIPRYDVLAEWRNVCHLDKVEVSGRALDCGHYIAEERSAELLEEIFEFLK